MLLEAQSILLFLCIYIHKETDKTKDESFKCLCVNQLNSHKLSNGVYFKRLKRRLHFTFCSSDISISILNAGNRKRKLIRISLRSRVQVCWTLPCEFITWKHVINRRLAWPLSWIKSTPTLNLQRCRKVKYSTSSSANVLTSCVCKQYQMNWSIQRLCIWLWKKKTVYFGLKSLGQNWSMLSRSSYGKEWLVYTSKTFFFVLHGRKQEVQICIHTAE